jgi:hypothetical protein
MAHSRRLFLKTGAASVAIVAAGGAGWVLTRAATAAREPWRKAANGFGDPRLDVLAYAILAPNPHNMQPWQAQLENDGSLSIFCDLERRLPATDPFDRQITIGFGCFLELLRLAAAGSGLRADITPFPDGEPQPRLDERSIASVTLTSDDTVASDPLFSSVLARRTCRLPFDTDRQVSADALAAVVEASVVGVAAAGTADPATVDRLRKLAVEAWVLEWSTPVVRRESIAVTRIGKSEINADPDGLFLEGPLMEGLGALGILTREQMDDPQSRAYFESESFYTKACATAMAFAWTTTDTNSRRDQIEAGRAWVRMQLAANAMGLAFHPLSQALQEYAQMADLYRQVHAQLGAANGQVVQMLARLGYAPGVPAAPRWPLESRLVPA